MGSEFFPNNRRKVELLDWDPLLNAQSEKRIRLDLLMPLTAQNILGMPDFVAPSFEKMDVEESPITEIDLNAEIEGICFEAFSTDTSKKAIEIDTLGLELENVKDQLGRRFVRFTNSTLRSFKVVRVKDSVCLKFTLTVKADPGLVLWAHHYHGGTFWALFEHSTVPMVPSKDDKQLKLGEGSASVSSNEGGKEEVEAKPNGNGHAKKGASIADCAYADGKGNRCILSEHDGKHEMAPITQGEVIDRARSRTQKEKDAVAAGKPRGFTN